MCGRLTPGEDVGARETLGRLPAAAGLLVMEGGTEPSVVAERRRDCRTRPATSSIEKGRVVPAVAVPDVVEPICKVDDGVDIPKPLRFVKRQYLLPREFLYLCFSWPSTTFLNKNRSERGRCERQQRC